MRSSNAVLITVVVCCCGCSSGAPTQSSPTTKLPSYHNHTRAQVIAKLGTPDSESKFKMSEVPGEMQIELLNTYRLTDPRNADVEIQELRWQDGDYWITLWLHRVDDKWLVLDSLRWHKDVRF